MNKEVQLQNAAPKLLDALQALRDGYQALFDVMPVAWQTYDDIAAAAIDKATADIEELVDDKYRCPSCGENRLDWLIWIEGDTVRCEACGQEYKVPEEEA